ELKWRMQRANAIELCGMNSNASSCCKPRSVPKCEKRRRNQSLRGYSQFTGGPMFDVRHREYTQEIGTQPNRRPVALLRPQPGEPSCKASGASLLQPSALSAAVLI